MRLVHSFSALFVALLALTMATAFPPTLSRADELHLPDEIANAPSLEEARNKLLKFRDNGKLKPEEMQQRMMRLAKDPDMERRLRSQPLEKILEGISSKDTGSPPGESRGLMSDIDKTLDSLDDYNKVIERAKKMGFTIDDVDGLTPFRVKIKGLDTVIWKPGGREMALADKSLSFADRARILGSDPEVAYEAGKKKQGAHAFMSVSENLTKGQGAFFEDLGKFSRSHAELEIVAGAKDVWRSLKAAGMCAGEMKKTCAELEKIKSMEAPPGNLLERQKNMRQLMGQVYDKSLVLLDMEVDSLAQRMKAAVDPAEISYLEGRIKEMRGQLTESVERMRILAEKFPDKVPQLTGGRSFNQIRDDMIRRGVKLEQARTSRPVGDTAAADRVRKVSYVVDALQFAECIMNGESTTECFKQAVGGYLIGEALSQGIYQISLVSAKGAVVASGVLTVAGLAATTYYTAVKLGEAYYEAREYLKARREEAEALERLHKSQQERVKDLAAQLGKLEATASAFLVEVDERKKNVLADLDKYERLGEVMEEARQYRSSHGPHLDAMLSDMSKAADRCNEAEGLLGSVRRKTEQAAKYAEQIEAGLKEAQKEAERCKEKGAAEKGDALHKEALRLHEENRRLVKSIEDDQKAFERLSLNPLPPDALSEAREVVDRLREYADKAGANLTDIVEMSVSVERLNQYTNKYQSDFKVKTSQFRLAFPENLTYEWIHKYGFPEEMATAWERRLEKVERDIAGVQQIGDDAWRQRRMDLMDKYHGIGSEAKDLMSYVKRIGSQFERKSAALSTCLTGGDTIRDTMSKLADSADTQKTLTDLAVTKLGKGYSEKIAACRAQSGETAGSGGAAPGKPKEEKPWVYSKFQRPVYLYRFRKETKDVSLMLARSLFDKDGGGFYMIPDGSGGVYHEDCEVSGPYGDEAVLCGVLRGYEKKSVSYIGGSSFVECPKDGPTAQPTFIGGGATTAGQGGQPPMPGQLQVGTVKGPVQSVSPTGAAQPVNSQTALAPGSSLHTGNGGEVSFKSPGGATVTVGQNTKVRMSPPEAGGKRQGVELLEGRVDVGHPEGTPNFDDVMIRSGDGTVVADGTKYRVEKDSSGTRVQVFEGSVRLTGEYIIRTYAPGVEHGKPSPVKEMRLAAGQQALMAGVSNKPSTLPSWMATGQKPAGQSPLSLPDPWNNSQVQHLIDQWISRAIPQSNTPGVVMHYNEWLQPLSQAARSTGPPDHPADWTRYRYAWENRARYGSSNLCTLGEFLELSISGKGTAGCAKGTSGRTAVPSWITTPNAPPTALRKPDDLVEQAHQDLARQQAPPQKEPQKPVAPPPAVEKPKPQPTPPPSPQRRSDDLVVKKQEPRFTGDWDCTITADDGRTASASHRIIKDKAGKHILWMLGGSVQVPAKYVDGNRIGFIIGDGTTDKDIILDFEVNGNIATGTDRIQYYDGRTYTHSLRCKKIGESGGRER